MSRFGALTTGWGGLRGVGRFWVLVVILAAASAGLLQYLGPMPHPKPAVADAGHGPERKDPSPHGAAPAHAEAEGAAPGHAVTHEAAAHTPQASHGEDSAPEHVAEPAAEPAAETALRVAAPDPGLLEPSKAFPPAKLPRVAADGRLARLVYAAPAPPMPAGMPRIALLLAGFGLSDRDSRAALAQISGPVSFAVSPYAPDQPALLEAARLAGHELLASIPMEPAGYPTNDEGGKSLRTGLTPEENAGNLEWALSRTQGAVGATGALDGLRGERFADVSGVFDPVADAVGSRGLLYIDPRPGRAPSRPGLVARSVDVVLDDSFARADIEAKLRDLERVAKERGGALGLAGPLRPVTIERIAAWSQTLVDRGMVLVPASTLTNPETATRP